MAANHEFQYDVFLSQSAKDKAVVRPLAQQLRQDGLNVWFDDWMLKPGDNIPAKIEKGLEDSRVLVLCMSVNAFGSDWARMEAGTFRFRDPLNNERRFIPLRLDEAPIKASLAQFIHLKWHPPDRDEEYRKLLEACRHTDVSGSAVVGATPTAFLKGHTACILKLAVTADGNRAITASADGSLRVWDLGSQSCLRKLEGHNGKVYDVALLPGDKQAVSCSSDTTLRVWNLVSGECVAVLKGHEGSVEAVAVTKDGSRVVSGSADKTLKIWNLKTRACTQTLKGHTFPVRGVTVSEDGASAFSFSGARLLRGWDFDRGKTFFAFEGHEDRIECMLTTPDGSRMVTGSRDGTVRIWDFESRRCLRRLEGHSSVVRRLAVTTDGRRLASGAEDGVVSVWEIESGQCLRSILTDRGAVTALAIFRGGNQVAASFGGDEALLFDFKAAPSPAPAQIQYTNAKVLLVGDSGVGKTGLSNYLAHGIKVEDNKPLPSTDGAWATHWPLRHDKKKIGVEREIWLWDFAGQVDYRLVHQLFMDETAAAVLVFNPQNENPFEGLGHWDRDLQKAARKPFAKLLAAARSDRGGLVVSSASMKKFMKERGFLGQLRETSAKTGEGCDELREAIVQAIDWKSIPETTSPALYHRIKQEILGLRDNGFVLIRLAELKQRMEMTLRGENLELAELEAVVGLLAGPGMIQRLEFGGFILLRPEVLSRYAAAVVRKVRNHPQELGCIHEDEMLVGDLDYQDFKRLPREDEAVVLRTLLETFISRAWCMRQPCDGSAILTFPSYFRRERKEQPSHPSVLVTYRFDGLADDIYATLVVRLHHTVAFQSTELWKSAADFKTQTGTKLGFTLTRESEGSSLLQVYFEPDVDGNSRVLFLRYVHDHLMQHAQNVVRLRRYFCGNKKCDAFLEAFGDQSKIAKALTPGGKGKVFCPDCGKPILLRDMIEEKFESPEVKEQVRAMRSEAQAVIDNESRELLAVHHTGFIVAEAGQIYRGYTNSDHGIDGEIEFKDDQGRASGKRLYMQLKSGDSYLKKRRSDGAEVFQIKNPRWADYWQQQAYAVMLVIRTSDGEIRWMDVSAYLKRESGDGKSVRQIIFEGERFDVMSVRRWRGKGLSGG